MVEAIDGPDFGLAGKAWSALGAETTAEAKAAPLAPPLWALLNPLFDSNTTYRSFQAFDSGKLQPKVQ